MLKKKWDNVDGSLVKGENEISEITEGLKKIADHFIDTAPLIMSHADVNSLYANQEVGLCFNKKGYRLIGEYVADQLKDMKN